MKACNAIFLQEIKDDSDLLTLRQEVYDWAMEAALKSQFSRSQQEAKQFSEEKVLLPFISLPLKQHCFSIMKAPSTLIGRAWLSERDNPASLRLAYIKIDEAYQKQGYARAAILLFEQFALSLGFSKISLNVFGHLTHAAKLYQSIGFKVIEKVENEHVIIRQEMVKECEKN